MKSIFSTQSPPTPRPSTRRSDEQGETARYGTTMEHMTALETGTIDSTICDTIDGTINQERRHGTGYQATSRMPMPCIIETEKTPRLSYTKDGEESGTVCARPALLPVRSLRPSRRRLRSFHSPAASHFDCVLMMNAVGRGDFPAFAVLKSKAKTERIPQWIISTISSQSP